MPMNTCFLVHLQFLIQLTILLLQLSFSILEWLIDQALAPLLMKGLCRIEIQMSILK